MNVLTPIAKLPPKPSVSGQFKVGDALKVGKDVSLELVLTNGAPEQQSVTVSLTAWSIVYTGLRVHEVWKKSLEVALGPKEGSRCCCCRAGRAVGEGGLAERRGPGGKAPPGLQCPVWGGEGRGGVLSTPTTWDL